MNEQQIIIGVLHGLGRRLWINRAIREAAFAVCVILFCLVCIKLVESAGVADLAYTGPIIRIALFSALIAVFVGFAARCVQRVSKRQAAGFADTCAHLKDELKSACCFMSEVDPSPWLQLQLQHAAATAAKLELSSLAPYTLPINAVAAGGLGLILAALTWMTPQLSNPWGLGYESGTAVPDQPADLELLLKDAPQDAAVEKLGLALRKLQQTDSSADEKRGALVEARDAIDQANMEASGARGALAKLAEALKSNPRLESVSQALDQGRIDEAIALLRAHETHPATASAQEKRANEPAMNSAAQGGNIDEALESTGRDFGSPNAVVDQNAINRITKALEQANERIDVQNRVNIVKRRMEANLIATSQRSPLTASQFDNRTNAPNPTPSPDTGSSNMRGGTLFRQAAVAREDADAAREGSQTGDASGDSVALPLEAAATRRLDAQLKLEVILQKDASEEPGGKGDPGWFYSASLEQKSRLPADEVRSLAGYGREDTLNHDRIPLRQKNIVKDYFLNLHESANK